jgi:hypothetical protein
MALFFYQMDYELLRQHIMGQIICVSNVYLIQMFVITLQLTHEHNVNLKRGLKKTG